MLKDVQASEPASTVGYIENTIMQNLAAFLQFL